ncbi:hypothetical protein DSLPV1_045 [Dishui lake phycodnavirus 1]|uniref:hypothetical protein n=1 Tax=Dishui lake phycodnavirus 1 TaxID=2079134 RepID=UPI000CD69BE0|nr:hypothetical protein C5Y57_gp045 [Dishui lake phycodnavirus 1]AUT19016.1 hypothetical protein DSLPV1_045 [Dishui lake phycodnavirus 1]
MKVIFAFPGNVFSGDFLKNWSDTIVYLMSRGYKMSMINAHSSFVPFCRMKTLGLHVLRGKDQVPFNGVDFDVWMTIDSDIMFTPQQVETMLENTKKYPVVCGPYVMHDNVHLAVVKEWDMQKMGKDGTFAFMTKQELRSSTDRFMKVAYAGMGFFAVRREVFHNPKMVYPYFHRPLIEFKSHKGIECQDMTSEDVAFCLNLADAGYDIMLDVETKVGHFKSVTLSC